MNINRWFQGVRTCEVIEAPYRVEPGLTMSMCLWTQLTYDGLGHEAPRMANIIRRHFPFKNTCRECEWSDLLTIIHANNEISTTREDIDKILKMFTEELDAA